MINIRSANYCCNITPQNSNHGRFSRVLIFFIFSSPNFPNFPDFFFQHFSRVVNCFIYLTFLRLLLPTTFPPPINPRTLSQNFITKSNFTNRSPILPNKPPSWTSIHTQIHTPNFYDGPAIFCPTFQNSCA